MQYDTVIIGAGLAGLSCAATLHNSDVSYIILEKGGRLGGRIKTDTINGFKLDRGFQVLQTGYPEAQKTLNYDHLKLHAFPAGVAIRSGGKFNIIADPRYHPRNLFSTLASPVGTFSDRLKMAKLARSVTSVSFEELFSQPEERSIDYLRKWGFSEDFITRFFVPFFAGACLDRKIRASSRVLRYIFRVFSQGDAALPAGGMEAIPQQIAAGLTDNALMFNCEVDSINDGTVTLTDGRQFKGKKIILATSLPAVHKIMKSDAAARSVGESCLYFAADWLPPMKDPFLILNGDGLGPINNIAFPSLVAPSYSTNRNTLIAVVVLGNEFIGKSDLEAQVREQCREWFGNSVNDWDHLKTYTIEHALPNQEPPTANPYNMPPLLKSNLRACGEYQSLPGTQWSLLSGRLTAEAVVNELN